MRIMHISKQVASLLKVLKDNEPDLALRFKVLTSRKLLHGGCGIKMKILDTKYTKTSV